ncbi:MAG: hypothetical protein ACKO1M_10080 [Planctomycetota bacterium]
MTAIDALLVAQAVASGMMAGIIWFVQVVHYPLFAAVTGPSAADYARANQARTSLVVLPPMLVEAAVAGWLVVWPPPGIGRGPALAGAVMVGLLWLSTLAVQMPLHARLAREGHAAVVVATLVRSNWPRTLLWTARAILTAWMLSAA